jgi:RNA polymerase sigma factor (sigma-70 family)
MQNSWPMLSSQSSDTDLLQSFANAQTKNSAFECLLDKYQKRVYWHVRRIVIDHDDADDVTQNTFVKIWTGLENYRGDAKLYTWIYRIATNEALQFLQKKKSALNVSLDSDSGEYLMQTLETGNYFNGNALELKLQTAILTLPDKQRTVFNMKYYDNMKYEDMSEVLQTSVGALKASYFHAVRKIEQFFKE